MDEITLKLQMSAQREMLRAMSAEAARDAAITRAETAESALAEWKLLGRQESERAEAAIVWAQTAEAALAALQTPCVCRRADDGWIEPGCGGPITTTRTYPFCMHCGHPQTVAEWSREAQP